MEIFVYRIVGVSPLLQHNPTSLKVSKAPGLGAKKVYDPAEEAEAGTYRNEDGSFYIPTACFRAAMLLSCAGRRIGKTGARTVLAGSVFPVEEQTILLNPKTGKPLKDYVVHAVRVVVQRNSVIRGRPKFDQWACRLAMEVDTEMLPNVELLTQILNIAGKIAGVMDFRPNRGGMYGRFTAELEK